MASLDTKQAMPKLVKAIKWNLSEVKHFTESYRSRSKDFKYALILSKKRLKNHL